MEVVLAIVVGGIFAAGIYMMLRRSVVKLVIGLALIGHAANLIIFTAGGLTRAIPALVPEGETQPPVGHADPLPQALILTAIVISFSVTAFAIVLVARAYQAIGDDDTDQFTSSDQ